MHTFGDRGDLMRRSVTLLVTIVLALSGVAGCVSVGESVQPKVAVAAGVPAAGDPSAVLDGSLPGAVNDFGLELARELAVQGENTVISPLSVAAALSMTRVGARGQTAEEMDAVLHVEGMEHARTNAAWADLLASLAETNTADLAVANSIWADDGAPLEPEFLDADRDFFGAEVRTLDLQGPAAVDAVNGWVDEQTRGLIPKIIDQFDDSAVLELVNAVYFLGEWESQFEPDSTQDEPFTLADGDSVDVEMMNAYGSWPYVESPRYQAVRLAYAGERYAAYVVVPSDEATAWELLGDGNAAWFANLGQDMQPADGSVALPKFELEWGEDIDLVGTLAAMGMPSAFDYLTADFSGISEQLAAGPGLAISRVLHKTYLRVDEEGTEAAAATSIGMTMGAIGPIEPEPFELRADRPFIFAIADERSGTLLFVGVVADPRG